MDSNKWIALGYLQLLYLLLETGCSFLKIAVHILLSDTLNDGTMGCMPCGNVFCKLNNTIIR